LIDGQLEDGANRVVVNLLVLLHASVRLLSSEDYITGAFLSRSSLDLDVRFEAERSIEGNDQVTAWDVETFFSDAGSYEDAVLLAFELHDLLYLIGVLLLNLQQHFSHL
jgi:hypothetical protein